MIRRSIGEVFVLGDVFVHTTLARIDNAGLNVPGCRQVRARLICITSAAARDWLGGEWGERAVGGMRLLGASATPRTIRLTIDCTCRETSS